MCDAPPGVSCTHFSCSHHKKHGQDLKGHRHEKSVSNKYRYMEDAFCNHMNRLSIFNKFYRPFKATILKRYISIDVKIR
jgi:hypothetical protein